MNYEQRGHWGDNKYRGNCSGHVIKDLLEHFQPKKFVEMFAGSGTGYDVAKELGYENSLHLDLNGKFSEPFNILTDDIPEGSDFVFSHPPYHNMVTYSGNMWGQSHEDDLSRCASYEEFIYKMNEVNSKIYNSLKPGGRHAMLIGDIRKNGVYYSMLKDLNWYGDLESHIIKVQNNYSSKNSTYSNRNFIPIEHEHLLIFKKKSLWEIPIKAISNFVKSLKESTIATWRDLVYAALESLGKQATLKQIYEVLADTEKAKGNQHYQAKIRQTLQQYTDFASSERGVWNIQNA